MNLKLFSLIVGGIFLLRKLMNKSTIIGGSYSVGKDIPQRLDALHSFESRKSDGFGGKMSTQINAALRKMYKSGINPDIKSITIKIDPVKYSVEWTATIAPSTDGKAYVGMITRGSAGYKADERAAMQLPELKTQMNAKLVKDLNFNEGGVKIRQYFYKYTLNNYPPHE